MMALDDVTVIDLSHALAGPFASTMLADYGARVIKVEPPGTGDIARRWGPPFYGDDSAYFVTLHRNKKSVEINLKSDEGRELFFRLAERADVVLENFRVGTVKKLGVGYEETRARNPRIIYCSVSGFGQDGPYRDRPAMDLIVQAESGMMSLTGEQGGRPVRAGVSIADLTAGINVTLGILMALHARADGAWPVPRRLDARGPARAARPHARHLPGGARSAQRMGTAYSTIVPYQTFRTKTEDIAIAVGSDALWRGFCRILGIEHLQDDPRYATNQARTQNREVVTAKLQEIFLTNTYEQWEELFVAAGIPVGAINDLERVVKHPQVKARGVLKELDHPVAGKVQIIAPFFAMSETPGGAVAPAPLLGEHTDEVLQQALGMKPDEIERLRSSGALGPKRSTKPRGVARGSNPIPGIMTASEREGRTP